MQEKISNDQLEVIYLHGFASGPKSSKAVFFAEKLTQMKISVQIPDLNAPDFQNMTLSTQLRVVKEVVEGLPKRKAKLLIGSSMGGLLATMQAAQMSDLNLKALILLAPGFGLAKRWPELFGEQNLLTWNERGVLDVFNYAVGKSLPLNYKFFEDISKHETENLTVEVPTLIFHGRADETVPITESESFVRRNRQHAKLYALDDDHQLLHSLEHIWQPCKELLSSLLPSPTLNDGSNGA